MLCYLLCYDDNYSEVMVLIYHVNYSDGSPIQEHRRIVVRHEIPGNNTINIIFSRLVIYYEGKIAPYRKKSLQSKCGFPALHNSYFT